MIKSWLLENFKSIQRKRTLNFKPLTLFVGANSTGKSTVIQSILLNIQTLQNSDYPREIVLNGHIVKLGSYNDVLSNLANSDKITFGFELEPSMEAKKEISRYGEAIWILDERENSCDLIECSYSFSAQGEYSENDILQLHPKLEDFRLNTTYTEIESNKKIQDEIIVTKSKNKIEHRINSLKLEGNVLETDSLNFEVLKPKNIKAKPNRFMIQREQLPNYVIAGAKFKHFLLDEFTIVYDEIEELCFEVIHFLNNIENYYYIHSSSRYSSIVNEIEKNSNLQNSINKICYEAISESAEHKISSYQLDRMKNAYNKLKDNFDTENLKKFFNSLPIYAKNAFISKIKEKEVLIKSDIKRDKQSIYKLRIHNIPYVSYSAIEYIRLFFTKGVKYLGPLRDEPKPIYPIGSPLNLKDIGLKGEYSAAVLDMYKNETIEYIKSDFMKGKKIDDNITKDSLLNAVTDWLIYMGIAESVYTEEKGKLGHEMKVKTTTIEAAHDLTNVGVGVSQVLPILLLALLSEKGSTLVFEQPELHLHPKVQTRLADFFVTMTLMGKQCIVETHSEYLINQLRYLVAISNEEEISRNTVYIFC